MNKVFYCSVALTLLLLIATPSVASIWNSTTTNVVNLLEDNDFEIALRPDGNNSYAVVTDAIVQGDLLLAISEFPTFYNTATNPDTLTGSFDNTTRMLTAVSVQEVLSNALVPNSTSTAVAQLTGASSTDWLALTGLLVSGNNTAVMAFDDPIPLSGGHLDESSVPLGVASATQGLFQYEFGFTGVANEFSTTFATSTTGNPLILTQIDTLDAFLNINVISQALSTPVLDQHNFLGTSSGLSLGFKALFTGPAELQIQTNRASREVGGFQISTDTDAYIMPVPEPITALVWLVLACCGAALIYRK